jgi:hypothetical protein
MLDPVLPRLRAGPRAEARYRDSPLHDPRDLYIGAT